MLDIIKLIRFGGFMKDRVDIKQYIGNNAIKIKDGVTNGITSKMLIKEKNRVYFFKENENMDNTDLHNDIAEVFSIYFFKKIGYDKYVDYKLVKIGNTEGVLSPSFISEDVVAERNFATLLTLYTYMNKYKKNYSIDKVFSEEQIKKVLIGMSFVVKKGDYCNSIEFISDVLSYVCDKCHVFLDCEKLINNLVELAILDYFITNADRHVFNLTFLIKRDKKDGRLYCELSPTFDQGCAFGVRQYWRKISKNMIPKYEKRFNPAIAMTKKSQICSVGDKGYYSDEVFEGGGSLVCDLIKYISDKPNLLSFFERCKSVNIKEVIEEFNANEPAKIDAQLASYIVATFNSRLEKVEEIEYYMKNNDNKKRVANSFKKQKENQITIEKLLNLCNKNKPLFVDVNNSCKLKNAVVNVKNFAQNKKCGMN